MPTLVMCSVLLAGCEPLRGIVSEKDLSSPVDLQCVDQALRHAFGEIQRWDYTGDGNSFPKGSQVAQFAYYSTDNKAGWATLKIGPSEDGARIVHSFTGIGAELPQTAFPPALEAMRHARGAIKAACDIDLSGMELREVGQQVDALD